MTPLRLTRHQETVRFTEVGCSAPEIRLGSAQDVLKIVVDSGPKQSFQIKRIDDGDHILADTPLIPAGESYLWTPATKGTYSITSTIYDGLSTTVTVGLSSTQPQQNNKGKSQHLAAVDDCLRFPLPQRQVSRSALLGVSTSSTSTKRTTPSPLSSTSSFYGTPTQFSASSSSTPGTNSNGSGGTATFVLPKTGSSASPSSASALSIHSRAARFEEDDEEYDSKELEQHPSLAGLRQRRRSVGTDTSDYHYHEEEQLQQEELTAFLRATETSTKINNNNNNNNNNTSNNNGAATRIRPQRRQLEAFINPNRRSSSFDSEELVKTFDVSRLHNGLVDTAPDAAATRSSSGAVGNYNHSRHSVSDILTSETACLPRCPRCKKDYACVSNQQRCMASHIKRGKQARHPPVASSEQLISFWNERTKEERSDIIEYSTIPEASNAFYDLLASIKGGYPTPAATTTAQQVQKAGKELTLTLQTSDKIDEVTGEQFLKILDAVTEGTLLFGSSSSAAAGGGGAGAGNDFPSISYFSSSSPSSFLECTVILGSVVGARFISALKTEQKRKAELACSELEASLVAEEQKATEKRNTKAKNKKNKKKKNKKTQQKTANDTTKAPSDAGDDADTDEIKEQVGIIISAVFEENEILQGKEEEDNDTVLTAVSVHPRPMFDSCVEETEGAVKDQSQMIQVEDSADGLLGAEVKQAGHNTTNNEANPENVFRVAGVVEEQEKEPDSENFIVDFSDDNGREEHAEDGAENKEREEKEMKAAVVIERVPVSDAFVVVQRIEKKTGAGKLAKKMVTGVTEQPQHQVDVGGNNSGGRVKLSKSARRRQGKKMKEQALRAAAAAELVPGEPPRIEVAVVEVVAPAVAPTQNTTTKTSTTPLLNSNTVANQSQPSVKAAAAIVDAAINVQSKTNDVSLATQNQKEQQQQQATPPLPEASVAKEKAVKKVVESTTTPHATTVTSTPAVENTAFPPSHAMPAMQPHYYGGPGYSPAPGYHQHVGYYPSQHAPHPHMEVPYNPLYVPEDAHSYPVPHLADTDTAVAGAGAAASGGVLPPPSGVPASAAAAAYRYSYMMPPPPPGMMPMPLHPMALPVLGTPAAAGSGSPSAAAGIGTGGVVVMAPPPPPPPQRNTRAYPSPAMSLSPSLSDGIVLGIPVNYDPQPTGQPQQNQDFERQQRQPEPKEEKKQGKKQQQGVLVEAGISKGAQENTAIKDVASVIPPFKKKKQEVEQQQQQENENKDEDRFKKMLWDAQLRSVNGDVALLRRLTAKLNESKTDFSTTQAAQVSSVKNHAEHAGHATFDMEAAKRYFEKKSKQLIEEGTNGCNHNTSSLVSTAPVKLVVAEAPANASKVVCSSKSLTSTPLVAVVPPSQKPYLYAALSRTSSSSNTTDDQQHQQKAKKKVRGPRHKHSAAPGAPPAGGGVEAAGGAAPPPSIRHTFSEPTQAALPPPPPPPPLPHVPHFADGKNGSNRQFTPARQNPGNNANYNNSTNANNNRRRSNNNSGNNINNSTQRLQEHYPLQQQQQQQQRSFLAAARAAQDPSKFAVPLKNRSSSANNNFNSATSTGGRHGGDPPQRNGSAEWKIQARS